MDFIRSTRWLWIFTLLILSGCSSPGPMQQPYGPLYTPAFEPIILATVDDGSEKIHFKEWTTMYQNDRLQFWGVFFITDHGAYMASWNTTSYEYNLSYKLMFKDIDSISRDTVERDMWLDSNLLVLTDIAGNSIGFALDRKAAARAIIMDGMMSK